MATDFNSIARDRALPPSTRFAFGRALRRYLADSIRYCGLLRTGWTLSSAFYRSLFELRPSLQLARYGDLDFDLERSVDTTRSNVNFRTQLMAALTGHPYYASEPWLFGQIIAALNVGASRIDFREFTFVDLGSGKGRALLMASDFPFRRIAGVEFMPGLHQIAERNIARYSSNRQQCREIESLCLDVRDCEFPAGPLVVYMFNSFPEPVFAGVLENLRRSLEKDPRPAFVAYRYPQFESLLAKCPWLQKVAGTEQWAVYRNHIAP
jgi:hypothetical protein